MRKDVGRFPEKPLEYQLVDLLGAETITDEQIEAIRVVLMFLADKRKREAEALEESELEALKHDLERSMTRENRYLNALMEISNGKDEAADVAGRALYPASAKGSNHAH